VAVPVLGVVAAGAVHLPLPLAALLALRLAALLALPLAVLLALPLAVLLALMSGLGGHVLGLGRGLVAALTAPLVGVLPMVGGFGGLVLLVIGHGIASVVCARGLPRAALEIETDRRGSPLILIDDGSVRECTRFGGLLEFAHI